MGRAQGPHEVPELAAGPFPAPRPPPDRPGGPSPDGHGSRSTGWRPAACTIRSGGGFHRYSTDPHWLVPHFEKMLYDNALLAMAYLEGYQATGEKRYADIVAGDSPLRRARHDLSRGSLLFRDRRRQSRRRPAGGRRAGSSRGRRRRSARLVGPAPRPDRRGLVRRDAERKLRRPEHPPHSKAPRRSREGARHAARKRSGRRSRSRGRSSTRRAGSVRRRCATRRS